MKNSVRFGMVSIALVATFTQSRGETINLDAFIQKVKEKNGAYLAGVENLEHLSKKIELGDIGLSPFLTADYGYMDDKSVKLIPTVMGTRTSTTVMGLGLAKQFSTGTGLLLKQDFKNYTIYGMPSFPNNDPHVEPSLSLSLSQDLWKNMFGKATYLRRAREKLQSAGEIKTEEYKLRTLLSDAETQYWNWLYKTEEVKTRRLSLERARRIRSWFGKRKESGLSNSTDVLQSEALVLSREINLKNSESELRAVESEIRTLLATEGPLLFMPGDNFESPRPRDFLDKSIQSKEEYSKEYIRPDYALTLIESKIKRIVQEEISEQLSASLTFEAKVASQSLTNTASDSFSQMASVDYPTWGAGLKFNLNLDRGAISRIEEQAKADTLATEMRARQMGLSSQAAILEIVRNHTELINRVEQVQQLKVIQREKLKSEEQRFRNGRSTTFQVVQFEQDAADAELMYLQLAIEVRKLESKTQIFLKGL